MDGLMIPAGINAARVYVDGDKEHIGIAEVDMPEVNYTTIDLEGYDIAGKYEEPILGHTDQLDATLKFTSLNRSIDYINDQKVHTIQLRAAHQNVNRATGEGQLVSLKVDIRGKVKEFKPGTVKTGDKTDSEITFTCQVYKITMDGVEMVNIDKFNRISSVNGIDAMEIVRNLIS
jgi:P2 family phage contractile tail tube protein